MQTIKTDPNVLRLLMAHDEALAALKTQVAALIGAVDNHIAEVKAVLSAGPVDNSSEFELMRAQLAEATSKLASAVRPQA